LTSYLAGYFAGNLAGYLSGLDGEVSFFVCEAERSLLLVLFGYVFDFTIGSSSELWSFLIFFDGLSLTTG
jgi:hypothetical protein